MTRSLVDALRLRAVEVRVADGDVVFAPGDAGETYLVPLSGRVRVEQTAASGRRVVLYRLEAGEGCVMTTTCLLSGRPHAAWGHAEGDVTALALGANAFHDLMGRDAGFRAAVLGVFSERVIDLTEVIDDLLTSRVDVRLAHWLVRHAGTGTVSMTHERIAAEIGSVREVVSRQLKTFERHGWVALSRGDVAICDASALARHAAEA